MNIYFPPAPPRVDYREFVRLQRLLNQYERELRGHPIRVLPNGMLDQEDATRVLREIGIDNATIVGEPGDYRMVPL